MQIRVSIKIYSASDISRFGSQTATGPKNSWRASSKSWLPQEFLKIVNSDGGMRTGSCQFQRKEMNI